MSRNDDIHPDHIDPQTNRPYADYSSPSLDSSFHDGEMAVDDPPMTAAEKMIHALRQWKCPSCGGSKVYRWRPPGMKGEHVERPCKVCSETGLHPLAREALADVEIDDATEAPSMRVEDVAGYSMRVVRVWAATGFRCLGSFSFHTDGSPFAGPPEDATAEQIAAWALALAHVKGEA